MYAHECRCLQRTEVSDPLELWFQAAGSELMRARGIELRSSGREEMDALKRRVITSHSLSLFNLLFLCVDVLPACMFVCHMPHVPVKA